MVNKHGETALHLAAKLGITEIVEDVNIIKQLLIHNADIDAMNLNKETPLHLAVENGHFQAAKILLYFGANKYLKNDLGQEPVSIAKTKHQTNFITLLENEELWLDYHDEF